MKILFILLTFTSLSTLASPSHEGPDLNLLKAPKKCHGLKITKAQRLEIKAVHKRTRIEIKKLMPAVWVAKKALKTVMFDASTTKEEAVSAIKEFRTVKRPVQKLKMTAKGEIHFDILSGEQRVKLLKCIKRGHHPKH